MIGDVVGLRRALLSIRAGRSGKRGSADTHGDFAAFLDEHVETRIGVVLESRKARFGFVASAGLGDPAPEVAQESVSRSFEIMDGRLAAAQLQVADEIRSPANAERPIRTLMWPESVAG